MNPSPGPLKRLDSTGLPLLVARLIVGGVFAWMAVQKLQEPGEFVRQVHAYRALPTQPPVIVNTLAVVLPWVELVCAGALLLGVAVRGAAAWILGLLLVFTPLLLVRAWGIHQSHPAVPFCAIRFTCGCGGTGEVYICSKVAENTALLLVALIPWFSASRRWCAEALLGRARARISRPTER